MEKKTISVHAFTIHIYTIAIAALLLLLLALGLKYIHLKLAVNQFTQSEMWQQQNQQPIGQIDDYALILATTIGQYPQNQTIFTQPLQLENYIATLSQSLKRDIVVVDTNRKILADTVVANMGSKYSMDTHDEVEQTLEDGKTRSFIETSPDYPQGITEVVVAIRNDKNTIIGALLISQSQIPQK